MEKLTTVLILIILEVLYECNTEREIKTTFVS